MKKKLLLSFAVFATALTVSAQKFDEKEVITKPFKVKKESVKRTQVKGDVSYYYYENNSRVTKELNDHLKINPVQVKTSATATAPLAFDTLGLYAYTVQPKKSTSDYWQRLVQGIPFNAPATLNSIEFLGQSKAVAPTTSSTVKVIVFDKKMSKQIATKTITIDNKYGYKKVVFDAPVSVTDTILVAFEMVTDKDLFNVAYSHNYFNGQKLKAFFTGDTTNLKNQPVFKSNLPFVGDAAILATTVGNTSILGLIKSNFDFFVYPEFTYEIKSDFQASKTCVDVNESLSLRSNANLGHLYNPVINYVQWDFLANKVKPAYTVFNFGDGGKKVYKDSLAILTKYSTSGVKKVVAKTMIGTWATAPYVFEDSTLIDIKVGQASSPVVTATILDAKCFNDSAKVTVTATGTGTLTGIGVKTFAAIAGTKTFEVKNEAGCIGMAEVKIKNAPTKVVATATVTDVKCFGDSASVDVKATGGTGLYTGTGIKKFSTAVASTKTIEVLDANKCLATVNAAIKASPSKIVATAIVTDAKCVGEKAKVEVNATGGKGRIDSTGVFYVDAVNATKKTYIVLDSNKCKASVEASINAISGNAVAPVVTVTVQDAKCFGDSALVDVKATGGTGLTGIGVKKFASLAGSKTLEVKNDAGCVGMAVAQIKAAPSKVIATATVVNAKCFGDSAKVTIAATGGKGTAYKGAGVSYIKNPKVSTIKYAVIDDNLCKSDSVSAVFTAAPTKIIATATVVDAKCFGDSAKVTVAATGGTGAITGTGVKLIANPKASTVKYAVMDASACKSDSVSAVIKAAPVKLEVTTAATTATSPTAVDGKATATPKGGTAPYTYAWDNTDKSTTAEIKVVKGTYKVVVKDANNCTVNGSIKVSSLSVESLSISGLSIYPNPVANELNVKFNAISAATIELVNVAGQVIASKDASEFANVTFDTATLNAGVYFVNIKVAEGVFTQKIIKE